MKRFEKILFDTKFLKLSLKKVNKWADRKRITHLVYALKKGLYDVRELAARKLGVLKAHSALSALIEAIDDKVHNVSDAAMTAIENIGAESGHKQLIEDKRTFWVEKERQKMERLRNAKKRKGSNIERERPSKKSYEAAKDALRKPMYGGKWF